MIIDTFIESISNTLSLHSLSRWGTVATAASSTVSAKSISARVREVGLGLTILILSVDVGVHVRHGTTSRLEVTLHESHRGSDQQANSEDAENNRPE